MLNLTSCSSVVQQTNSQLQHSKFSKVSKVSSILMMLQDEVELILT